MERRVRKGKRMSVECQFHYTLGLDVFVDRLRERNIQLGLIFQVVGSGSKDSVFLNSMYGGFGGDVVLDSVNLLYTLGVRTAL